MLEDDGDFSAAFPDGLVQNASHAEYPEVDPMEQPGLFEGDIILTEEQKRFLNSSLVDTSVDSRNAMRNPIRKWPGGVMVYTIARGHFNSEERETIYSAMREYTRKTCIRFRKRTNQRAYIYIHKGKGCFSLIGRSGKQQNLSLGKGCLRRGIVMHELMHAAGFFHEQGRNDRDKYIWIYWGNILPEAKGNFQKQSLKTISHLGQPYDLSSIMHYGRKAFSKNKRDTIVARHSASMANMGQRKGFSRIDIKKLNILYKCNIRSCENKYEKCRAWALQSLCTSSEWGKFMQTYCQLACGMC